MAGIGAASASKTHAASTGDASTNGFVTGEQIRLSTSPTGSGYAWALAIPSASSPARSAIDDATAAQPAFTPDVPGFYVVTVTVGSSTVYVLRIAVGAAAFVRVGEGQNMIPIADSQMATPQVGVTIYYSSDQGALAIKDTAGNVFTVDLTAT